jgi:hypothetical protein
VDPSDRPSGLVLAIARLGLLWAALLLAGGYAAAFGWRPGAILILTGFLGNLVGNLVTGFAEYRRVMSRPWPEVSPVEDDEDD